MTHLRAISSSRPFRLARLLAVVALVATLTPIAQLASASPAAAAPAPRNVTFEVSGAQGGSNGGKGAVIQATTSLAVGATVEVTVGGTNGYNGGGAAGNSYYGTPGAGGGASDLRIGGTALADRVLVAGGGGGKGAEWHYTTPAGGGGVGAAVGTGGNGGTGDGGFGGTGGSGATTSAGGSGGPYTCFSGGGCGSGASGSLGTGGSGGTYGNGVGGGLPGSGGAGGGGGYYGGGGGAGTCCLSAGGGGGGGSSYVDPTTFSGGTDSASNGARSGHGRVRVSLDGGATWVATYNYSGSTQTYTVPAAPVATSVDVGVGPTTGGTTVTLTGEDLTDVSALTFCGTPGTSLDVVNATTVSVVTPAGSVGTCDLGVQTNASGSTTLASAFRYYAVPVISTASPSAGPLAGASVTLTGAGFTTATDVAFGSQSASAFTVDSDTQITATAPAAAAGQVSIDVVTPDATGTGPATFTYTEAPTISSVAPGAGPTGGGTSVTITGSDLGTATAVAFGPTPAASFTVDSASQITAATPALAEGAVDVSVTTPGGTATDTAAFRAYPTPAVTAVAPAAGPAAGGATVTLTGTDFDDVDAVTFDGADAASFTVDSDTQITAITPAHASGAATVDVANPGGAGTSAETYTFVAAPKVTTVDPVVVEAGTPGPATLTGANLTGATDVTFGGAAATSFTVDSDTRISAGMPALSVGVHTVEVDTVGGTGTGAILAVTTPTIASLSPIGGPVAGGTTVTITGTGFTGTTKVAFGDAAASFTVDSDTELTVVAPAGDPGVVDVTVANPRHTAAAKAYTYTEPLTLRVDDGATDVEPGSTVDLSGGGFAPGARVDIMMFSTPRLLTTVAADAAGRYVAAVIIPADTTAGPHRLVATGVDALGAVQSVSIDIEVVVGPSAAADDDPAASDAVPSSLAATGRAIGLTVRTGLVLLVFGALLVFAERKRTHRWNR